jgi:hypothetical protein
MSTLYGGPQVDTMSAFRHSANFNSWAMKLAGVNEAINDKLESAMEGRASPGRTGEDARRSTISCGGVPRYQAQWLLRGSENSDCGSCAYYEAQQGRTRQSDQNP